MSLVQEKKIVAQLLYIFRN